MTKAKGLLKNSKKGTFPTDMYYTNWQEPMRSRFVRHSETTAMGPVSTALSLVNTINITMN
jgi:hypothetical protein